MIWIVQTLFPKASWPPTVVLHEKRKGFFPYFCHFSTTSSSPHLCFDHAFVLISLANFSSLYSPIHFLHQTPLIVSWSAFLLYSIFIFYTSNLKNLIWTWIILTSMVIFCLLYQTVYICVLAPTIFLKQFSIMFLNA